MKWELNRSEQCGDVKYLYEELARQDYGFIKRALHLKEKKSEILEEGY